MSLLSLPHGITALRHEFAIPLGPETTLPRWVYSFVAKAESVIAVDAGVSGATPTILAATGGELSTLVLTHAHPDHLGSALSIQERTRCVVCASARERTWIESPDVQLAERPVPGFWQLVEGGVPITELLEDGSILPQAPRMKALATPGHSPGHLAFWDASCGVLFSGDAIPVPGEMPIYDDARSTAQSLARLRELPVQLLLSAWDVPREGAAARQAIELGAEVVRTVELHVRAARRRCVDLATMTADVARALALPPQLAGPLLARTVRAHLDSPLPTV